MRPGQQNGKNRSRGRGNGGRKHLNPLSRSYESNGPDVKIRGNAAHIAEKYQQLARDAHASGDSVMAENYLQHAEHYFRILSAAQMGAPRTDQFGFEPDYEDEETEEPTGEAAAEANGHAGFEGPFERRRDNRPRPPENQPRLDRPAFVSEIDGAEAPQMGEPRVEPDGQPAPRAEAGDAEGQGEAPRRGRRPRRRRTPIGEGQSEGEAAQPDIGELPAFLTAGSSNAS